MIFTIKRIPELDGNYATAHCFAINLLQDLLRKTYQLQIEEKMIEKGPYGKPFLKDFPGIQFSISHCNELVACAIDAVSVGIDVEKIRPWNPFAVKKVFTQEEQCSVVENVDQNETFFRLWTLKESLAKADGRGLSYPFLSVSIPIKEGCSFTDGPLEYEFAQRIIVEKYVFSVCRKITG